MSTSTDAPAMGRPEGSVRLAAQSEEDVIDELLFEDADDWGAELDGWLIDQTLEESGIIFEREGGEQ